MSLPLVPNTVDAATLADELVRYRVVDSARLNELLTKFSGTRPNALLDYLVGCKVLTAFQAERALAGEARILALGPYRLTGGAGLGTFGPLFTAGHTSKPGAFTVRVLPLRSLWKAKQAKQLARTLSTTIKHPAVVPLLEVDSANGLHYLVWPQVEGERLADRVAASGPMHPGEAAALLGHLVSAVGACHARKAVHGAITPQSVAIGPSGLPLLLELGAGALLAQNVAEDESLLDSMSSAFASAGVLAFAAPELAEAPHAPVFAVDQYALGAIGYFALTGLQPYLHPTLADQHRAKRAGPPPSASIVNPAVPTELAAVIERMMAPNSADRFATLEEIEERFAAVAMAGPVEADQPEIESLMLSKIREARASSGAISWSEGGSGVLRPVERDDSDASVTFELPDAPETLPNALSDGAVWATPQPAPPSRSETETPAAVPHPKRDEAVAPPSADPPSAEGEIPALPTPAPPRATPDPRLTAPVPVQWHTTDGASAEETDARSDAPPPNSVLWKKVKRNLLFWKPATDAVRVSVFGPNAVTPGQTVALVIYLHTPDAERNVRTLARAFQHDAELIGSGYLSREVARASELAVHLSVANAGVAKSLVKCEWRGQPRRLAFELHVPWESPEGASPGLVSVGQDNVRIGKIEFRFNVLPRKA